MIIPISEVEGYTPTFIEEPEEQDNQNLIQVSTDTSRRMREDLSFGEELGRGVGAGVEELKGIGAGLVGALGSAVGSEGLEDWGFTTAQERFAAASSPELSGEVNSIFDIEDAGDFVSWAARTMGKQAPQLAFSVLGGGVGGIVGKKAVSSAITEALEAKTAELVGKGIAANVAKEQAQLTLTREMGENIATKLAAEKAAQVAAMKAGIAAAGSVQGVGMEIGSIYADTRDLGLAVKYGVPAGAVEGITDLYFGSKIVDALAGKQATRGVMRELGTVAGVGTVMEGGTEVGQTRLEQMARAEADPNYDINSKGATRELMEAGAAGALTGGVMGGGTTIASRLAAGKMAPLTMRALQDKETGLPDGTTPADQQSDDPASLYQFDENPVTIDDGGRQLVARRFTIGTEEGWAIDNPNEEEKMLFPPIPGGRVAIPKGMVAGSSLRLNLDNGGRLRNLGPGDSRSVEDDSDYEGFGMNSPEFPGVGAASATGDSRLDTEAENAMQSEQRRFEDQALAPYRTLKNVFNAIDAVEKAGSSEERAALLQSATDPQELRDARYQLRAAKNQAKTPQEKQFFADLQGRFQDFNALKQASRALGIKSQDGQTVKSSGSYPEAEGSTPSPATPFEGASNLAKGPNPVDQATRRWAGIVEGKAQAKADFYAAQELKQEVPQESTGFESYDEYEKVLAERNETAAQLKSLRGTISKGSEQDKQAAKTLIKELEDRQNALSTQESELLQKSSKDDEFLTELQKQTSAWELSDKNTNKWDTLNKLQKELDSLQDERGDLITNEQVEAFDADENKGLRFEQLLKEVDAARKNLTPDKKKQEIVKSAFLAVSSKRKVASERDKVAAPQRESLEKEIENAQARDRELDTKVVYTDPQTGSKFYGALIPDPQTGKATNANGKFLFMLRGYGGRFYSERSSGPLAGTPTSDLNDPRATNYEALKRQVVNTNFGLGGMDQFDQPIEFTPQQMVNVAADTRSDLHEATKKQAKEKGIEGADGNTYIQNEVALAQKKRDEDEEAEDTRRMNLEPVEVKKLREGDLVGFRLPDNDRLHHTHFLSTGAKLTPTSAGKFRTAQNKDGSKQVIFDRYYVASPRGNSTENHLGKVSLPVMKPGETLVTLSDLSDAEKGELGYKANESTGENISDDLWKYLYKPPTEATFASELGAKSEMPTLRSNRPGTQMIMTPGQGDYALYQLKGDLTETEKILTLALGKFSPNPTKQDLIAAGFTPTSRKEEIETPNGKMTLVEIDEATIPDPVSKSGLQIPINSAILVDKKNPKAPKIVKAFASFDPAAVLEAKRNLEQKKNAPDSPQKNANIDIAEKSLKTAVWELQRVTLAQMNAGLDVRVKEDRNGIPITDSLAEYGFGAERTKRGVKDGQYGKHIITRVAYNPNPDFMGEGQVFTRKVPTPKLNQQQAAATLTNESLTMRGVDRPKTGLGAANEVLGNFRTKKLEQAQKAKERDEEAILSGSDLMSRNARELSNLTAFTRPIFEQYVSAIHRTIEESPNDPALKDRALMEAELALARELNKFQMKAMPESVAKELRSQIKTLERQAEAIKPVRGKKRVLKKGKDYGKLVDAPAQTKTQFEKQQRQWKQNLEKATADLSDRFYRQMIPRATKGKAGVTEIKKIDSSLADLETSIRNQVASEKIPVQPSADAVADAIKADKRIKDFNSSLAKAKGDPAKNRWKEKIALRKQEIEKSLVTERDKTEGEIETEARSLIQKSEKHAQLRRQLDRAGELTPSQEKLLDSFLEYVQAEASMTADQNRKTVTENLRRLLGRQKEAREGGRQMFINVRKEIEKVEKKSAKKQTKQKGQDAAKIIGDDEAAAAQNEEMIDSALKAMDFATFTENDKLYERAAEDFAKATAGRKKALSRGDKAILRAFGKIMDEVKALKIFGTGKVPGILTQAFSAANNFKNAIQKQEFFDPETGKVVGPESEVAQAAIAGEIDPLALARAREPRKSNAEIEEQYKQDLARDRLQELAEAKIGKYGTVDPNLPELAFVKLFGGEFNGEVEGKEINASFPPLEEKYSRPLFRYMSKDFGSDPGQRLAVTELANAVLDDYLFNPDADGITETQLTDNFAVTDRDKLKTPERVTAPRPRGATVKIDQKGQRVFSLAAKNQGDITQSNRDAVQTPSAPAATSGRATQQFVQEYAELSDAEMVALGQEEIDAIYRAATSKADADLAESAMDSVIATSPSIEQLAEQDVDTLRRGLLEEVKAKQSRGDAEAVLRKNLRDASKNRLFKSTNDFLNHIAGQPAGINRATAMRAKEFLKLNSNGSFNWNKIGLQVASFGKGGKAVNWAGASAADSESRGGMALYINLDAVHNGGLVNTVLEEMDHALTHQIINHEQYGINLNPVQKDALDRLRTAYKQAVLKAGDGMTDLKEQTAGMTPEEKVAFYSGEFMKKAEEAPEYFRPYYNLTDLDEFVVGVKQDKDFHDLLIDLGFNEKTQNGGFSLKGLLKDLFTSLAELLTGRRLDPNSELARVFKDSWTLSIEREPSQWTVPPTKLSMALGLGAANETTGTANGMPQTVRMQKDTGAFYNASLVQDENGNWSVQGEFGSPGQKPRTVQKNKTPLDYDKAKSVFDKLVEDKSKKYSILPDQGPDDGGSTTPQGPAPQGPKSLAGARTKASKLLSGKKEGTTYTGQKVTTGGYFSSDPNAPANIEGLWNKSTALKGSDIALAEQLGSKLNKQAERYAKAGNPLDTKTVQTALGDIENPYTEEQKRQIDQAILENRAEDAAVLKTEFRTENRANFRRRQAEALSKLPQDIQELLGQMRDHIDQMSRYVDETMGFEVAENFGIYLNRSYLNFGDEKTRAKWQEQVRENPKIMQDLRGYVLRQLADHDAEALVRRATREGRILPRAQAVEDASKALTEADIAAGIERVLNFGGQGIGRIFLSGKIPGQKPMKVLDERGNIAPELQAAWGMIEDPATNYVNTALKLTALVSNDRFLQELKDEGLKTGMLYDPMNPANISAEDSERLRVAKEGALAADDTLAARSRFKPELLRTAMAKQDPVVASILEEAMDPTNIPAGYVKLSGETNKSLAPVSGMYAEPTLAEWMFQKFPPQGATNNMVMEVLTQLTLIPMAMKTVGSVAGQVRNYISGWQSLVTAGNFRPWDADWRRDMVLAHKMTFGNVFGADAATRKAVIQARKRFGELRLMDQGVTANFMQDLVGMNANNDASVQKGFLNLWNKATKFAVKAYGASDDNFKIMHYLSELGKLRRAFPGESQEVLEERAAQIARDIHQTYSDTYGAVKALKKVPFIAPFISFTSEVIRNSINLVRLARNEIREGKRTGNKELERNGWNRVRGMIYGWGGTFALTALSRALVGVTPEEEDDLRRLLPDWQKNSQLVFTGKSGGKINFYDVSFSDPSNYLKRPVIAFMTSWFEDDKTFNERVGNGISEAVMELAKPFLSEQLFSGAVMDVARNKDASGREIVNWQDTPFNIAKGITGHIGSVFLPGTVDTLGRIYKGATGVVSDSGRSYDLGNEITAAFGLRPSEVNVRQALGFRSRAFMQGYRDAASLFSRPFLSQGTKSAGDIESGYERANDAYQSVMENFRQTYIGAIRLGVPANEVRSILKANGISDEVLSMIQSGRIRPYKASKQAITRAREAGQTPRIQEYDKAYATASRNL